MKLSITQIAGLASLAGFSGQDLSTAVAVALAESGGDPSAYNPEKAAGATEGHGSFGLWQIYLTAHPEYQGVNLTDPQTNANAAYATYAQAGNSFRPWSTFKSGAYLAYMDQVTATLTAPDAGTDSSGGDGSTGGAGTVLPLIIGAVILWWGINYLTGR